MNPAVIPFQYQSHAIRTVTIDGEPWFVAVDICAALTIANARDAISKLDDDERQVVDFSTVGNADGRQNQALSNFDPQTINIINESGLYSLILTSRKPEAKAFKKWVTSEVLPSIRKTGRYAVSNLSVANALDALRLAREGARVARMFGFRGNMVALSADQFAHSLTGLSVLEHMGASHLLADQRGRTYTPTELGQMCSPPLSARRFNLRLEAAGLQTRELEHWLPTDAAQGLFEWLDTGKHHHSGTPVKQIKWFRGVLEKLESVPSISDPQ